MEQNPGSGTVQTVLLDSREGAVAGEVLSLKPVLSVTEYLSDVTDVMEMPTPRLHRPGITVMREMKGSPDASTV